VPAREAFPVEEGTATHPVSASEGEQDSEWPSEIERVEQTYSLKVLGPLYHHALACITCKVLHPLDHLDRHWKDKHPRFPLDSAAINVLKAAGACPEKIPVPKEKVLVVPFLEEAEHGFWCSKCQKAAPSASTVRHSAEHKGCPGTISHSLVQRINKKPIYWAVFRGRHQREGCDGSVEVSEQQVEREVQAQRNLLPDAMTEDRILTTNHRNISQFLSGTEWLAVLGQKPL